MAITISGENNNDRITAQDGVIDTISGFNIAGIITASSFTGDLTGDVTGNITGNINNSTLLLQTGGTERLRITSGGNIGIGTDNPATKTAIVGSDSGDVYLQIANSTTGSDANSGFLVGLKSDEGATLYQMENNYMRFGTNGAERVRITAGGAVLLGATTTSNVEQFRIHTQDSGKAIIKLTNSTTGTGTGDGFEFGMNGSEQIEFVNKENTDMFFATNNAERLRITSGGNVRHVGGDNRMYTFSSDDSSHYMKFNNTLNGIILNGYGGIAFETYGANERLRITSGGSVGIGTDNPATKFHFQGGELTIKSSGESGPYLFRNNGSGPDLVFHSGRGSSFSSPTASGGTDLLGNINFAGYDGSSYQRRASINGTIDGSVSSGNVPTAIYFRTGSTAPQERLRIKPNGNVEIGTVTDAGNTLRYFDIANYNTGNSAGVVQRMLTRKSDGTSVAGLDIVKYKAGGAYLINYETIGSNGFIAFSTGENAGSPIERLRIHGSGAVTKPYQYVFTVSTSGTTKNAGWTKIIGLAPYTSQCTGVSDGTYWSNTNQQFTAPVTGVYYFFVGGWASPSSNGSRYAYSFKHQNGNNLIFIGGGDYCTVDSPMAGWSRTIKLSAGEWVELWAYSAISATWGNGSHHFFWGGYLLG